MNAGKLCVRKSFTPGDRLVCSDEVGKLVLHVPHSENPPPTPAKPQGQHW